MSYFKEPHKIGRIPTGEIEIDVGVGFAQLIGGGALVGATIVRIRFLKHKTSYHTHFCLFLSAWRCQVLSATQRCVYLFSDFLGR